MHHIACQTPIEPHHFDGWKRRGQLIEKGAVEARPDLGERLTNGSLQKQVHGK